MCDPVTIAGVALTAVSTSLNYAAQAKVQRARDDAMAAERIRQNTLDKEASALNVQSQDRYQDFQGKQEERGASLADFFQSQEVAEPDASAALPATSSNITVKEEAKQRDKAKAFTDQSGEALGQMRSFGDLLGDISRLQGRDATQIGTIGGFKRGSSNVLGYELDAANSAGNGLKLFGDLAGGFGGLALNAGLSGVGAGAAADPWAGMRSVTTQATAAAPRPTTVGVSPRLMSGQSLYSLYG